MDRSLRPPLVIYSFGYRGCSLFALLAALTSAMFLEVWLDRTDGPSFRVELNSAENPREAAERLAADLGKPLVVRDA